MSAEHAGQQARRTPRAKHKHSKSGTAPASDSEGIVAHAGSGSKRSGRRNQQAGQAAQPVPLNAWQNGDPSQMGVFFDAHGNAVGAIHPQSGQVSGMFYMSDGVPAPAAHQYQKKSGRQGRNGRNPLNGANTPPHASSDTEHILSTAMNQAMTPAKAAAYAGPTFHASPAANALPIPKFFSKSVPSDAAASGLQARLEQETENPEDGRKANSPPSMNAGAADILPDRSHESPLDFLFKADKEQKAKRQSAGATLTPPASRVDSLGSEPTRTNPWQSIYGTGPRNHQRHSSNGSGREVFMMELDGRDASPRPKHLSPPPPLPRIPDRSLSDHTGMSQRSPQIIDQHRSQIPPYPPAISNGPNSTVPAPDLSQPQSMDHSYSPFNRADPYPTPRSQDTTPIAQQGGYPPQNGLHYGNRNLSPLFKAAKQDPARPSSGLRQELYHGPAQVSMAELPDSSPSRPANAPRRSSTQAEKAALAYLQTHVPSAPAMPTLPLSRTGPSELDGAAVRAAPTGVAPPGTNLSNTKSIEDDLKRMLKLTGGIK